MAAQVLKDEDVARFKQDGYVMVKALFGREEINLLRQARNLDKALKEGAHEAKDGEGGIIKLALWNEVGNDIYGLFSRCHRVVDSIERLLGGEVYHFHSKMILKEPYTGGAWAWHQDYGYWYDYGCLFPDLASCMIAVDPATKENGCLQVLKGSHRLGRINHGPVGDQTGADLEHVEAALKVMERVYCVMDSGDAIFFHCNLLHRSDQNKSPNPRWALICAYNAAWNSPYKASPHSSYTPLEKVPDSAIKATGLKLVEKTFYKPR